MNIMFHLILYTTNYKEDFGQLAFSMLVTNPSHLPISEDYSSFHTLTLSRSSHHPSMKFTH